MFSRGMQDIYSGLRPVDSPYALFDHDLQHRNMPFEFPVCCPIHGGADLYYSSIQMPTIAFGTGSKWKGQDVTVYVQQAIKLGFVHLDSAQFYRTEQHVGKAVQESGLSRSDLFITTKYSGLGTARWAITGSLDNIGVKSVDLYLIHNPRLIADIAATWSEFEKFKNEGLTKSIGVSNFNLEQLQKLVKGSSIKPAVNQIYFNPYNYAENKELLAYAAKHGIVIEAYSSLSPITRFPGGPVDEPINAAAKRLGATPTQVILAWVRSKGVAIVTTSSSEAHMKEYLHVADLRENLLRLRDPLSLADLGTIPLAALTEEEIAAIDEAGAKGEPTDLELGLCCRQARQGLLSYSYISMLILFAIYVAVMYHFVTTFLLAPSSSPQ
ncbi:NADP-dependent oxidoreductase domain-containing protein [Cytidiella melzeri]|nr:NADP-dependent oxidoreductase domain-containing protein [Cytidiella melzeri]